jgi:hypothetical protein
MFIMVLVVVLVMGVVMGSIMKFLLIKRAPPWLCNKRAQPAPSREPRRRLPAREPCAPHVRVAQNLRGRLAGRGATSRRASCCLPQA